MTKVEGEWLTAPETQAVCGALSDYQVYFVGGCVRNALIEAPVADVDISTSARPDQVIQAAKDAGLKAIPTGIDHGTVTVMSGGVPHEVTTFRKDVATDGRRAVVAFADRIEEDALRRDFTMNALYARPDGTVVDPLGGLPDIVTRRVRFIEDPGKRIKEDYLRILRFFRFHAWYGNPDEGIDADGLAACAAYVDGIDQLSKERIGAEMLKLLGAPDPAPALASLAACGALVRVLPGASPEPLAPLVYLEGGRPAHAIRRLAALGGEKPQENLRLRKSDIRALSLIRKAATQEPNSAKNAYFFGPQIAEDAALVRAALMSESLPEGLLKNIADGAAAVFPVKASDLPDLEGRDLGQRLKSLEDRWVSSGFKLNKDELLK